MQPFTLDQTIIAGMSFVLGLLIGMFLLAGSKWKKRYAAESARVGELERENARLGGEVREYESLRHAAARNPVAAAPVAAAPVVEETRITETTTVAEPYRRVDTSGQATPDVVIRRT